MAEVVVWPDEGANSYVSLPAFVAWLEEHSHGDAVLSQDEPVQARALITARRQLDRLPLRGRRSDPDQPLAFPRRGLTDDGVAVDAGEVPSRAREAQMEWALLLAQKIGDPAADALGVDEVQVGPLRVVHNRSAGQSRPRRVPEAVRSALGDWYAAGRLRLVRS